MGLYYTVPAESPIRDTAVYFHNYVLKISSIKTTKPQDKFFLIHDLSRGHFAWT